MVRVVQGQELAEAQSPAGRHSPPVPGSACRDTSFSARWAKTG